MKKEDGGVITEICPKCSQAIVKFSDGKYRFKCQVEKEIDEENPDSDSGYGIEGICMNSPIIADHILIISQI